ncbi:uncharacterized protein LOC142149721 [Mixophyes fleayi]|uniref:uncharacterized protein LOC142149721 n=1 Tax=Mixophyes fleayi TaxID=3061075 RepID=UPI003F4DE473
MLRGRRGVEGRESGEEELGGQEEQEEQPGPSAGKTKSGRNVRFSFAENCALVHSLVPIYDRILGSLAAKTPFLRKKIIWQKLTDAVNAVGHIKRSVDNCRKRISDIKRRVKEKMFEEHRAATANGGGPAVVLTYTSYEDEFKQLIAPEVLEGINVRDTDRPVSQPMAASAQQQKCPVAAGPLAAPAVDPDEEECVAGTSQEEDPSLTLGATDAERFSGDYIFLETVADVSEVQVQADSQPSATAPHPPRRQPEAESAPTLAESIRQFSSVQENLLGFHQDSMRGMQKQLNKTYRVLQHMHDEQCRFGNTMDRIDTSLAQIHTAINQQTGAMREMFNNFIGVVGELITRLPLPTTSAGTSLNNTPSPSLPATPVQSSERLRGGRRPSTSRAKSPGPAGKRPK